MSKALLNPSNSSLTRGYLYRSESELHVLSAGIVFMPLFRIETDALYSIEDINVQIEAIQNVDLARIAMHAMVLGMLAN